MRNEIAIWGLCFIGAICFAFSLKTKRTDCYLVYTITFALCVATVVVNL